MGRARFAVLVGLLLCCVAGPTAHAQIAAACSNEAARTGPSASLPDCRAYEQVTPADKSSAVQDMDPSSTYALAAADGNSIALQSLATLGPEPQLGNSFSVLSRTPSGWVIASVKPLASGSTVYSPDIFNSDLTQVGVESETQYPFSFNRTYQVGVPGGSFATVAMTPRENENKHLKGDRLLGASEDLSHVVFGSVDHALLSPTPTGTDEEAYDLYEWVNSRLQLINVSDAGSVIGKCGAMLGRGFGASRAFPSLGNNFANNAVSADGSKIFFTVPDPVGKGEDCYKADEGLSPNASRLYMRVTEIVGGREEAKTIELSAPQEVSLSPEEEEMPVFYEDASVDGSKVFFLTERALVPGAMAEDEHLYEYDTEAPEGKRLKLIFQSGKFAGGETREKSVFSSEDGSVVYFYRNEYTLLYKYEAAGGGSVHEIASMKFPNADEFPYVSPNGEFFMFVSKGVTVNGTPSELRGAGRDEIYRYDSDGSVLCVSCGSGDVPTSGEASSSNKSAGVLETTDETPTWVPMSANGNQVFFDSTGALVPEAVNEGVMNVYEWEADGAGGCMQGLGCTYLISQGNSQRESYLIGASTDGSNVFFVTHAQLVPQDIDNSADIYDARVDGGFPPPAESGPCLGDTCQSVPPALNDPTPAWLSFSGPENPVQVVATVKSCAKGKVREKNRCVKRKAKKARRGARRAAKRDRGGSK